MGVEYDRAQREAAHLSAHETPRAESSGRTVRERALLRYLGAELKRRAEGHPEPEKRTRAEPAGQAGEPEQPE